MVSTIQLEYRVVPSKSLSEGAQGFTTYGMQVWCRINGNEEVCEIPDISDSQEETQRICRILQTCGVRPVAVRRALDCYFEDQAADTLLLRLLEEYCGRKNS